ncbi:hypothetical protein [Paraburkholderia dioscoreae]|uniref:Uncharacterized protein n=1 Tax=Paraburkholderia dioscoreae TaxID=2604047 RepID=A0A5Q4ZKS4_9BURK|nr:hypothetical protein [Paraburkholderia dioscoreae]VVD32296.1 conserved protein of unknown function [Paraburkholderia dioscoreae]
MRVKSRGTVEQSESTAFRPAFNELRPGRFYKPGTLAAIVVATGLLIAISRFGTAAGTRDVMGSSRECSARYVALLDLAELARRDGKSSEVVVRGLNDRGGAMSGCVSTGGSGSVAALTARPSR